MALCVQSYMRGHGMPTEPARLWLRGAGTSLPAGSTGHPSSEPLIGHGGLEASEEPPPAPEPEPTEPEEPPEPEEPENP
jgi:hypothetical protein